MKKLTFYTLIFFISIGLFSPMAMAQIIAEEIGTCTYTSGNSTYKPREIERICLARPQPRSWAPDPIIPPGGPIGVCKFSSGRIAKEEQTTRAICLDKEPPGSWTINPTVPTPVPVNPNYILLAPFPCPEGFDNCILTPDGKAVLKDFNPRGNADGTNPALGKYLNLMIRIIIGLSAVLAVVMIVIGGMEYMTSELISSKEAGKEKITQALLGLLIALGAYALLFTINPDLLSTDVKIEQATIVVTLQEDRDGAPPSLTPFTGVPPSGPTGACTVGVTLSATTGIVACSSISNNIDQMVAAARQAGLTIWAGGFRTLAQQTELRRRNCGGNITDPGAQCNPLTAVPGTSRHESGLALDLTCGGITIQSSTNDCFIWLKNNAGRYGLQNLIGGTEPWHWSTDGH